jgi:iron(III) transport system permease protein
VTTCRLGLIVACLTTVLGFIVARHIQSAPRARLSRFLGKACFVPLLVPDIVFATAYIAMFAAPIGPLPTLYGTFALLVLAMTGHVLPYSVESARAVLSQINPQVEEAARLTHAKAHQRILRILVPLVVPGLIAGAVMVLVKTLRDIALVVVLFTPATATLSILAFRYGSEGFLAQANAVTVILFTLTASLTLAANRLSRRGAG